MSKARVTPADLQLWRAQLSAPRADPAEVARRLLDEVELLLRDLARSRQDFALKAAGALEKRLAAVGTYNHGGCPACRDAEARAFLAKLKKVAGEK